jgi:hypothetical protein
MLGLLLTTKMFIYNTPETFDKYLNEVKGAKNDGFSIDPYFNTLSFANETLPLGDQRIEHKMNATLSAHSYKPQSYTGKQKNGFQSLNQF